MTDLVAYLEAIFEKSEESAGLKIRQLAGSPRPVMLVTIKSLLNAILKAPLLCIGLQKLVTLQNHRFYPK